MLNLVVTLLAAAVLTLAPGPGEAQTLQPTEVASSVQSLLQPGQAAAILAKASVFDAFIARDAGPLRPDVAGELHLRYDRTYQGLPVLGGDIIVHLSREGLLTRVTTTLDEPLKLPSVVPSVERADAQSQAEALFRQEGQVHSVTAELLVAATSSLVERPALVWMVRVKGRRCGQSSWMHYVIDAHTRALHKKYEGERTLVPIQCANAEPAWTPETRPGGRAPRKPGGMKTVDPTSAATGSGSSLYYGTLSLDTDKISDTQYDLRDTTRGSHFVSDFLVGYTPAMTDADNTWGNGTTSDRATVAVDAAYGQRVTWDYYKNRLERNGIANDGAGYASTVHYREYGVDIDNAKWDGSRMKYGDGKNYFKPLVSLDIAGHEMTHGVTQHSANLTYAGESGALNEATSDIFGTMIEYYASNANDPPDYMIGEKIVKLPGWTALRFMYQPSLDSSLPWDTSIDCWHTGVNFLDPHQSSGIGNHFYYLLTEGSKPSGLPPSKVCKDTDRTTATDTIVFTGIGQFNAEQLWYHALTNNMSAGTSFKDARVATLASAKTLYGDDSGRYRVTDYAWLAVNVSDVEKVIARADNKTRNYAQIVAPSPELVVMGRTGVVGKSHWYAFYLDPGKSGEVSLTAADATTNFNLIGYDTNGTTVLAKSEKAGGAKESMTLQNTGTLRKLVYASVPKKAGTAPYILRVKLL